VETAPHALLDDHAANLAIEVAEDVVQIGAIRIAWDESRGFMELGFSEDGSTAAVTS
jgi:hypothetical protein